MSARRYRYTGKERDDETGLYYHGARYYAPWLGRWTAADPSGMVDGPNLYAYVRGNPVRMRDLTGWFSGTSRTNAAARGEGYTPPPRSEDDEKFVARLGVNLFMFVGDMMHGTARFPETIVNTGMFVSDAIATATSGGDNESAAAEVKKGVEPAAAQIIGTVKGAASGDPDANADVITALAKLGAVLVTRKLMTRRGGAKLPKKSGRLRNLFESEAAKKFARKRTKPGNPFDTSYTDDFVESRRKAPKDQRTRKGGTAPREVVESLSGPPEVIGNYEIYGTKRLVGSTFERNVALIRTPKKSATGFLRLAKQLEAEALAAGATRLRITGHLQHNPGWTPGLARRMGYTFRRINGATFEASKVLK